MTLSRSKVMYGGKGFMMDKATNVVEFTDAGFAQQRPDLTHTNTDVVVEKSAYQSCDNGKCGKFCSFVGRNKRLTYIFVLITQMN